MKLMKYFVYYTSITKLISEAFENLTDIIKLISIDLWFNWNQEIIDAGIYLMSEQKEFLVVNAKNPNTNHIEFLKRDLRVLALMKKYPPTGQDIQVQPM